MRQVGSGSAARTILCWLVLASLVPAGWAYVNGGDFHDSRKTLEKELKAKGWGVSFAGPRLTDDAVNELVGRALQALPAGQADRVPIEAKRAVARIAREAIKKASATGKDVIETGQVGPVRYHVGTQTFESYWETNYNKKREIHARRTSLASFAALKVTAPQAPGKK